MAPKFSRKMEETVAALLNQPNVDAAARSVGISVATLVRWQKGQEFQRSLREARRVAFGRRSRDCSRCPGAAVATLSKMMVEQAAALGTQKPAGWT